jgi:hypothetical protein
VQNQEGRHRSRGVSITSRNRNRQLPETESVSAEAKPSAPAVKSHRILVADDNRDIRSYLQRILGSRHQVETVNDGKAALCAAKANPPDLILADIMMPRMNGFQLLAAVRAYSRTQDVPVILLSARAGQEAKASGIEAGAVDYLVKPFNTRELLARVGSFLESAQKNRAALNRSEQALVESGERFQAIFNASPIAIAINSLPDGRFIDANDSYVALIGFNWKEVIGHTSTVLGIWADPDDRHQLVQTLKEKGALNHIEGRLRMKSGEIRNVLIVAKLIELDGAKCVLSLVQDITKRKKAEEKLRRSEAYLAEAERLSHTASWAWNVSTGEIFWSRELFQIYGLDPKKVTLGYPSIMKYIHPDDRSGVRETFDGAVRKKKDYELGYRVVRADGTIRHVNNIAHPVFDKAGTLIEYVGTTIDITERKQAEEAVRKAHEQVDVILASISDQFFALSKDWRFTYFNQHAAAQLKLLGKDPAELLGKVLWDEFPEVPNEANLRRVMSKRVALTEELYHAPLGQWLENHIYPSPDGGIVMFQRYVTERKKAEAELRRSAAYLAQGQRLSHTGSWALNVATRELFWSDEHFRILGLDPGMETPPYPEAIKFIHPDDRPWIVAALERAMRGKTEFDAQCRVVRPDGTILFIRSVAEPVFNKAGDLVEYVGTMIDITEQLRAEEELRRSESHLAEAQRIGQIGSWIWNVATGECLWSREHFHIFGLDPDTFKPTKENTQRLIHPEDLPCVEETLQRAAREKSEFEIEYRIVRPDGVIRYHHGIGRPMEKTNGNLEFIGMAVDITARKQTEKALQEAQTELAHVSRMSAMGEMAAAIAHEINQPLGAIVNNSNHCLQLVGKRGPQKKTRAALRDIVSNANRASDIITRVRALTKRPSTGLTELNVRELTDEALTLAKHSLNEHGISVKTKLAEDAPAVHADRVQLQQVLLNLIVNAIDAMRGVPKERRILTISARLGKLDRKAAALISIADKGIGFTPKTADRMFDAFYTTKPDGMGMGLRISRSIIESFGGQLSARRNKGRGATFSFILPV